jgi:hypothetical protein
MEKKMITKAGVAIAYSMGLAVLLLPGAARSADEKTLNYGVGLRAAPGYTIQGSGSPDKDSAGVKTLDVRPYISGQVHPLLKFEGNLDLNNGDQGRIHVLDAVVKVEPHDLFNVWMGRFLPPSDRANLSGPYYQNAWNFPPVNFYPAIYAGRADGAAVWGMVDKGRFKYQGGVFTLGSNTPSDQLIYAGRLVFNFLDPEPGYYNSSTYYGAKDVLALGGVIQYQQKGASDFVPTDMRDLTAFNLDLLFEKRLPIGDTISLEGAFYNFNKGGQGRSFFALASYLFGTKTGFGQFQPMARYTQFTPTGGGDSTKFIDGGINYIIDGHKARLALVVQNVNPPGIASSTTVQLGVQIQE